LLHRPNSAEARARLCIRLVLVSSGLAGCSAFGPFVTYPPQPVIGDKVAICYDGTAHSLPTVQKAAQDECGPGTLANLRDTECMTMWRRSTPPITL
jgi:hypothetical protein